MNYLSMMTIIALLPFGALFAGGKAFDDKLPPPPYREVLDDPGNTAYQLGKLLEEKKFTDFYEVTRPFFRSMNDVKDEDFTKETFKTQLWILYDLASAPILDFDTNKKWLYRTSHLDYTLKWSTLQQIESHDVDLLSSKLGFSRKELTRLLASYAARVMKNFQDAYDPYFGEKDRALRKKRRDEKKTDDDLAFNNRQIGLSSRSVNAGNSLRILEKGFIRMLLRYFPGNANEIRKYIRQAGYGDGDVRELLDLTVGHDKQTDFLYKGLPRKTEQKDERRQDVRRDIAL